jgi:sigma-E factor negative regulatory protein RseA
MKAMDKMDNQELISALADGQLQGEALVRGIEAAVAEPGLRTWRSYCVVGEVLRSGLAPAGTPPEVFLTRFRARLQQEQVTRPQSLPVLMPIRTREQAANDWRWKMVAGVASVAAVAAVSWNTWAPTGGSAGQPRLALAPAAVIPVAVDPRTATMIRDPRLDQLLQAHRQLGSATALPTPSVFLRNATFEGPAR